MNGPSVPADARDKPAGIDPPLVRDIAARTGFAASFILEKHARLKPSLGVPVDMERLVEQLLVQETFFFRHALQWEMLRERLLTRPRAPLTAWCAGCATGEEAWSLAYLLADAGVSAASILSTDISPSAVSVARAGRYQRIEAMGSFRVLPDFARHAFPGRTGELWDAPESLRAMLRFEVHNLIDSPPAGLPRAGVDLVFCRNTLIYFSEAAVALALRHLAGVLREGGLLMLGTAETIRNSALFEPVYGDGAMIWQRTAAPLADGAP